MAANDDVSLHAALAEASDPATPPARLAEIAYQFPSARSRIAINPSAYPALVQWILAYGETPSSSARPALAVDHPAVAVPASLPWHARVANVVFLAAVPLAMWLLSALMNPGIDPLTAAAAFVYAGVLLVLARTPRLKAIAAGLVLAFCAVPLTLSSLEPASFAVLAAWLGYLQLGVVAWAWLIARGHDAVCFLLAPAVVVVAFGWELVIAVTFRMFLGGPIAFGAAALVAQLGSAALVVAACWIGRWIDSRVRSHPSGLPSGDGFSPRGGGAAMVADEQGEWR